MLAFWIPPQKDTEEKMSIVSRFNVEFPSQNESYAESFCSVIKKKHEKLTNLKLCLHFGLAYTWLKVEDDKK